MWLSFKYKQSCMMMFILLIGIYDGMYITQNLLALLLFVFTFHLLYSFKLWSKGKGIFKKKTRKTVQKCFVSNTRLTTATTWIYLFSSVRWAVFGCPAWIVYYTFLSTCKESLDANVPGFAVMSVWWSYCA